MKPSGSGENDKSASEDDQLKHRQRLDELLSLLRRHRSELAALGHSALPLANVKLAELPIINLAVAMGEDFAAKTFEQLHDDAVRNL